jgi:hypothetical protein
MTPGDDDAPPTRRLLPAEPAPPLGWFSVELTYVEPDYAARTLRAPRTYRARFSVHAASPDAAVAAARERFEALQRASSVGWERRITSTRCAPSTEVEAEPQEAGLLRSPDSRPGRATPQVDPM